jgi:hypothetical protein
MANHLTFDVLSQLVEARTDVNREPRARRHLASCARCRSELEWLRRIHGLPDQPGRPDVGWSEMGDAARPVLGAECRFP